MNTIYIPYDELHVGHVYYGELINGSKYYFKYLGHGKWTHGVTSSPMNAVLLNKVYSENTNKVFAITEYKTDNPCVEIDISVVKYKVINHISNEPFYRCIPN